MNSYHSIPLASHALEHVSAHEPSAQGRYGKYGGRFVPEALIPIIEETAQAYTRIRSDQSFLDQLNYLQEHYVGRPSPIYPCSRFGKEKPRALGKRAFTLPYGSSATFYLKREDLNHTGSHKINNALGQCLLAQKMGKRRVIAETGAGQHGVATATACALLNIECVIYMGVVDTERQSLNVARMRLLGAEVVSVASGSGTLKDAITEAFRDWVAHADTTYYCFGTAAGPHPFPALVRDLQRIIGLETKTQMRTMIGGLPDAVFACIGGGSNAIGMFHPFIDDSSVGLYACEAGGDGITTNRHASSITGGEPGVFQGSFAYLLHDEHGQIQESHSISAGLDYPGVGPEHSHLADIGRVTYLPVTDAQAMEAYAILSQLEGIIPAIESAHALAGALLLAPEITKTTPEASIVINLSGRGDKDVSTAGTWFDILDDQGKITDQKVIG